MTRRAQNEDIHSEVEHLHSIAIIMDSVLRIPGTRWRIGADALIGLIPVVGDGVASMVSFYLVIRALRLGIPFAVVLRMIWNILLELVVGSIPLLGDLFDVTFKANLRNVALLKKALLNVR